MSKRELHFDRNGYRDIVQAARDNGYRLVPVEEGLSALSPVMMMRHDVDLSLELAVELARLENEIGVRSTYFVMVTNDYYSPFNAAGRAQLRELIRLGHKVGLHWDSSNYDEAEPVAIRQFQNELALLGDAAGEPIRSASQHIPTDSPLFRVADHVEFEVYGQIYRDRFRYVADSSMKWRDHTPMDLIEQGVDIHFCSHPIWWVADREGRDAKLRYSLSLRIAEMTAENESFIAYISEFLKNREAHDKRFVDQHGEMNQ